MTLAATLGSVTDAARVDVNSPKVRSSSMSHACRLRGLSFNLFPLLQLPQQPAFRKRKLSPLFSSQAVWPWADQIHHKSLRKAFHWNPGTTTFHGTLINGGSYIYFMPFHQEASMNYGEPYHAQCPGGLSADSLFFHSGFLGVPSQSRQEKACLWTTKTSR